MIAKFREKYFNISPLYRKPIRIWRYDFVDGFNKKVKDSGLVVFEKFIDITEIDEIFDVGFSALWNESWCGFDISFETNRIEVYSNNPDFARKYDMEEIERLSYKKIISISEVSEFKVVYMDSECNKTREESISIADLKILWGRYITELLPH